MKIAGQGGNGRSTLVKTLVLAIKVSFNDDTFVFIAAPTGSTSNNGRGAIIHGLFNLRFSSSSKKSFLSKREDFENHIQRICHAHN